MIAYIKRVDAMKICRKYSTHCFASSDAKGQDVADKIEDEIAEIPIADVVPREVTEVNEEIKIINRLIAEAVIHGADSGGSYDQNTDGLMAAITNWLVFKGMDGRYIARYEDVHIYKGIWEIIQICPKGGEG